VNIGQQVSISINVTNTGDLTGAYTVTLKVDGAATGTKQVTLAGGTSETVTFTTSKSSAGTYQVSIDDETGRFTVREVLSPANFSISDLTITPGTIKTGEGVSISVLVSNTGEQQGSYDVQMKINGQVVETKSITLAGGTIQAVTFTSTGDTAGSFTVAIAGESGSYTVEKPAVVTQPEEEKDEEPVVTEPVEEAGGLLWWPYAVALVALALLALGVVLYHRRQA